MPKTNAVRVRFSADNDFTPDHRTFAFTAGLEMDLAEVLPIFACDDAEQLAEAFKLYGVPAEILA